jgi:hypothetical protein
MNQEPEPMTERSRQWQQFVNDNEGWPPQKSPRDSRCFECYRRGLKNWQEYKGVIHRDVTVATEEIDESAPGGFRQFDREISAPYDVWRCSKGHEYTDGY